MQQNDVKTMRTGKEKVYFRILFLFSLFIWAFLLFSVFRQFAGTGEKRENGCFVRDQLNDTVTQVDPKYLLVGESCLAFYDLTEGEQKELRSAQNDVSTRIVSALTTPVIFFLFFIFSLYLHYLAISYIRMNAVKVGPEQFPEIWQSFISMHEKMHIKRRPDIFILMGNGVLNAFATKLIFRQFIVIYSDLAEALIEEQDTRQLDAVMAHELGHHVLGHTRLLWEWFFMPISFIPFVLLPLNRAREYSSDRVMKLVMQDDEVCARALVKLAAGKIYGKRVNISVYLEQGKQENGLYARLAEIFATHPHLPNRIRALQKFSLPLTNTSVTP
jgi:Zn-dependent protease with chaperone function